MFTISRLLTTVTLVIGLSLTSYGQLTSVSSFGSNPGNLKMYYYSPSNVPAGAPVVVALHGCGQDASVFSRETEWNDLADVYGFHVVYPEQKTSNNVSRCFNWFESNDIRRGSGEALSIRNMVAYMKNNRNAANTAYVMGLSAGGGMTAVMLATYPEVFRGGAVMAGVPYKAATPYTALSVMSLGVNKSPKAWGDLVRNASSFSGEWPKLAVFHGTYDNIVNYSHSKELVDQFLNLHDPSITSSNQVNADNVTYSFNGTTNVTRGGFEVNGKEVVVRYSVYMGHAISVDPYGRGREGKGGRTGTYSSDRYFYSPYFAAKFWGLTSGGSSRWATTPNSQLKWYVGEGNTLHTSLQESAKFSLISLDGKVLMEENISPDHQQLKLQAKGIVIGLLEVGEEVFRKKFYLE
ncbi:extracellular catalytic domain type 1 short-chain-length polyhydroxyalkanoate depolymerase [Algivirga pacifica]|uniref:PHB depolymerase family esterase n=1 Tax=Algivirga pacifica TaxID=1162670 RepID=A0ABP9DEY1_9BACT